MTPALECSTGIVYCAQTADDQIWVSLNGDNWIPVTCEPSPGDYPDVVRLFDEDVRPGLVVFTQTFARRWLFIRYPERAPRFWTRST